MKIRNLIIIFCLLILSGIFYISNNKQSNPYISSELANKLKPYYLPKNHPIKDRLDIICKDQHVVHSYETMIEAGFNIPEKKEKDLVVASHPDLPGYLIKLYHEDYEITEWPLWLLRIEGAERVKKSIKKNKYQNLIRVPKKWIYPLPPNSSPESEKPIYRKNFILVIEDMNIVNDQENERLYKEKMTPELQEALFTILKETQLYDSIYIDNNPFTKDGKLTFIDTEEFDIKPVNYDYMTQFFSEPLQEKWQELTANP